MSTVEPIDEFLKFLSTQEDHLLGSSIRGFERPFPIRSEAFLQFAETDLLSELPHKFVNALSNTKRAIDCQVDCIFLTVGINLPYLDFPKKLGILNDIGLITPRILTKVNRMRNLLEHQFINPTPEKVTDALDTAILFVAYTNAKLQKLREEIIFDTDVIGINLYNGYVEIRLQKPDSPKSIIINSSDKNYFAVLKWVIHTSNEWW